ncbi:MAG: ABC transporter ATP-binding protein, partial [Caldimonas sp.]
MEPARVEAQHIEVSYGNTPVLRDVNLTIEPGEFFALLGPSGSGKSTLLRLIAGFVRQQAGRLLVGGRDIGSLEPWKRDIGMVFQSYALWPHLSVTRNVAFGLEERKLDRHEVARRSEAALDLVGLGGFGARRPSQLSGGQQQRVALARTLAIEPRVLLLDEPLSNLDARLRVQMREELLRLHRRLGLTTIFVTHDQEEALTMSDRVAVLDHGVIQQVGTPVELFDAPVNRFVAEFVGSVNLFAGEVRAGGVFVSPAIGDVQLPASLAAQAVRSIHLAFRPHVVELEAGDAGAAPSAAGELRLDGHVRSVEFMGEMVRYDVTVANGAVLVDRPHRRGGLQLAG